jgi:hypothetical protein
LFVSQILTLYTTPVIYLLIDRVRRLPWRERLRLLAWLLKWPMYLLGRVGR